MRGSESAVRRLVAVAVAALGLVGIWVGHAQARTSPACAVPGTVTRVLTTTGRISYRAPAYAAPGALYGCLNRRRKVVELTDLNYSQLGTEQVRLIRLSGAYSAFVKAGVYTGADSRCYVQVHRVDLLRARRVHFDVAEADDPARCPRVSGLVLSPTGGMAWVVGEMVQAYDASGLRVLDRGGLEPGSLALSESGRTVYWRKDGTAQSAPLG